MWPKFYLTFESKMGMYREQISKCDRAEIDDPAKIFMQIPSCLCVLHEIDAEYVKKEEKKSK